MATKTKSSRKRASINAFHQRLAQLTYYQACQLLGEGGAELIRKGGQTFQIEGEEDTFLGGDLYRLRIRDPDVPGQLAIATLTLQSRRSKQLQQICAASPKRWQACWRVERTTNVHPDR